MNKISKSVEVVDEQLEKSEEGSGDWVDTEEEEESYSSLNESNTPKRGGLLQKAKMATKLNHMERLQSQIESNHRLIQRNPRELRDLNHLESYRQFKN